MADPKTAPRIRFGSGGIETERPPAGASGIMSGWTYGGGWTEGPPGAWLPIRWLGEGVGEGGDGDQRPSRHKAMRSTHGGHAGATGSLPPPHMHVHPPPPNALLSPEWTHEDR